MCGMVFPGCDTRIKICQPEGEGYAVVEESYTIASSMARCPTSLRSERVYMERTPAIRVKRWFPTPFQFIIFLGGQHQSSTTTRTLPLDSCTTIRHFTSVPSTPPLLVIIRITAARALYAPTPRPRRMVSAMVLMMPMSRPRFGVPSRVQATQGSRATTKVGASTSAMRAPTMRRATTEVRGSVIAVG